MLGAELALPRGGGPGEGQKKPPADGRGFGVGYLSLLFASRATVVARGFAPGSARKSCRFHGIGFFSQLVPPGRGFSNLLTAGSDPGFPSGMLRAWSLVASQPVTSPAPHFAATTLSLTG